ncbi:YchJ family protein [Knoellia sinensis]|uniref:YchJ family protein n=1 Tax=Knoellia sinensis TaxID=136100 RepID=UPI001FE18F85|nr:YchJ family metal-binding protein [Knoellia sinensis]
MSAASAERTCPCGGRPEGATLAACCGPYLAGEAWPPEPEAVMRSRYTAYATGDADHVFRTWHPATRPSEVDLDPAIRWTGLDVLSASGDDTEGTVEFAAHWLSGDGAARQRGGDA